MSSNKVLINKENIKNFSKEEKYKKYVWNLQQHLQDQYYFGVNMKIYNIWKSQNA